MSDEHLSPQECSRCEILFCPCPCHHKSVTITELYLGLEADRENRNRLFRGEQMFAATTSDVVTLRVAE